MSALGADVGAPEFPLIVGGVPGPVPGSEEESRGIDDGGVSDTMTGPLSDGGSADDLKKEGSKVCGAEDARDQGRPPLDSVARSPPGARR